MSFYEKLKKLLIEKGIALEGQVRSLDKFMPIVDVVYSNGSTVFMKIDGERTGRLSSRFTFSISGGLTGDSLIITDAHDIDEGVSEVLYVFFERYGDVVDYQSYFERHWLLDEEVL